jgi:hypothetical protein
MVEVLRVGAFGGSYRIVAVDSAMDTAFTGTFMIAAAGDSVVAGSGKLSNLGSVKVRGVVRGDTLDVGMSNHPDDGICLRGTLQGSQLVGSWQACGFPPQPPPHGSFTAHRS